MEVLFDIRGLVNDIHEELFGNGEEEEEPDL